MCKNAKTRETVDVAVERYCMKENEPLLNRTFSLRREEAVLLGYETHADVNLYDKMAKTPATVLAHGDLPPAVILPRFCRSSNSWTSSTRRCSPCSRRTSPSLLA